MVASYYYTSPWQPATHLCHLLVGLSLPELFPMFGDLSGSSAGRLRHLAQHTAPHSYITSSNSTQHLTVTSHPQIAHSTSLSHHILTQHTAPHCHITSSHSTQHLTSHPHTAPHCHITSSHSTQHLTSHPHTAPHPHTAHAISHL